MLQKVQEHILYNHAVKKVKYGKNRGVVIDGIDTQTGKSFRIEGDYIVSTVSVGVLQNKHIEFEPELPERKQKAIDKCKMAVYCKIFMKFENRFWDKKDKIYIATEKKGYFNYWCPIDKNLIFCVVVGDEARRVEGLSVDDLKSEI